jgi:DNA-binding MurR/RpiR family transcriptional regulator
MPLRELLTGLGERQTQTDRRLIESLLERPRETAFLSANEIAQRAGVDPATAVRFARKLGFDGYPALRARLQQELFGVSEAAEHLRSRIQHLGKGSVLKAFVEAEISHLGRLPEQVSDADLVAAARMVMRASQTFLFAVGHAGALAQLLESRLGRAGYRTRILKQVARDMAADLLLARAKDAFILFALNAAHPLVPKAIEHARRVRARSIVVTDIPGLTLRPNPDIVLSASRGAESELRSLSVPMALCNALVLHLSRLDQRKAIRSLERLDAVRHKLEETP